MDVERIQPQGVAEGLRALQAALKDTSDLGDMIPEESRRIQGDETLSSFDEGLMDKVALALVQAELVAEGDLSDAQRFKSTREALDECGVPMEQFLQMSGTQRFMDAFRRYNRLFFTDLRYGRILKAASASAMNGSVTAMKLVMDQREVEQDAVQRKLEEVEQGGQRAFLAAVEELRERLRRMTDRAVVRKATDEQLNAARSTASERRVDERSASEVDHRALMSAKPDEPA